MSTMTKPLSNYPLDRTTEESHQILLRDIKTREKDEFKGYKFLSLVKEIDPLIVGDLRASWRSKVYNTNDSIEYTDPRLGKDYVARCRLYEWFQSNIPVDSDVGKTIQNVIASQSK